MISQVATGVHDLAIIVMAICVMISIVAGIVGKYLKDKTIPEKIKAEADRIRGVAEDVVSATEQWAANLVKSGVDKPDSIDKLNYAIDLATENLPDTPEPVLKTAIEAVVNRRNGGMEIAVEGLANLIAKARKVGIMKLQFPKDFLGL